MVRANATFVNFAGGEVSEDLAARTQLDLYKKAAARVQNFLPFATGPVSFRPGTVYVHHTRLNQTAVFIPFQFSDSQAYLIEATDLKFRFYKDNGIIVETAKNITGITQANPGVVTSAAHGYSDGDEIFINNVVGMTELNGKSYLIDNKTTDTYTLTDIDGNAIDTSGFTAYSSGGESTKVYEITTPFVEADLTELQYAQNADTMYLTHQNYEPRKLTRSGHTSWSLATFTRDNDFIGTSADYPRSVIFTSDARTLYGGTPDDPESLFGSRSPSAQGVIRFDDFTDSATVTPTMAVYFTLAPVHGKVDSIQFLANTDKFIVAGTFGGVRRIFGDTEASPISPEEITAKPVNAFGCAYSLPVSTGTNLFYIERGRQKIRSFEYDYTVDGYLTSDRTLVASHLPKPGIKQISNQNGDGTILWAVRLDGPLLGMTYNEKENVSAWHRHYLGGSHTDDENSTRAYGRVLWSGIMPRSADGDQLWIIVEREIDGATRRHVEYFADPVEFPLRENFYTGASNEDTDDTRFHNALYESAKTAVHLDASLTYNGNIYGIDADATLTLGATTGTGVTVTADNSVFTSAMVGRQIWVKYDMNGAGGGRAEITGYTSGTEVEVDFISDAESTTVLPGDWYLTATSVSGLYHLEGETVGVCADGEDLGTQAVTSGAVTLQNPASVIVVGLPYLGILKTLNLDAGGTTGSAQSKLKTVSEVGLQFLNTQGAKFGTDLYTVERILYPEGGQRMDRPTPLFTGIQHTYFQDNYRREKHAYVVQASPQPCTVLALDLFMEAVDE